MTARHQIRVGGRLARARSPIDSTPAPSVGEVLQAARDRKGVDLHRAERDTKIRAKHLAALESGDYTELPGPVYARGFLRNYATYLGLDPEEVLKHWREAQDAVGRRVREPMAMPPQPLVEPKGHLRFTRGVFVGVLLTLVALGFLGYVGVQLLRFSHPPRLTLDQVPVQTLPADTQSYLLSGTVDLPNAVVTVNGPSGFQQTRDADAGGAWSMEVPVSKGRNDFELRAQDPQIPDPDRGSAPVSVILTVPIPATPTPMPQPSAGPSSGASTFYPPAEIVVTTPLDGAQLVSGPVTVSGSTNATMVSIKASDMGPAGVPQASARVSPVTGAGASPTPLRTPGLANPASIQVPASGGAYVGTIGLAPGRWLLTISAEEVRGLLGPASQTLTVEVGRGSLVLEVRAMASSTWIRVVADNRVLEQGRAFRHHEAATYNANDFFEVQTGNAGATQFVLNGKELGALGSAGQAQTWRFEKGKLPKRV